MVLVEFLVRNAGMTVMQAKLEVLLLCGGLGIIVMIDLLLSHWDTEDS